MQVVINRRIRSGVSASTRGGSALQTMSAAIAARPNHGVVIARDQRQITMIVAATAMMFTTWASVTRSFALWPVAPPMIASSAG